MESSNLAGDSGAAQLLPARHFPAFSACGRVGGGFSVEGSHSNAQYNRHIRNLTPRATRSCNSPSDTYSSMDYPTSSDTPNLNSQQTSSPTLETKPGDADHRSLTTHQPCNSSMTPEALNAAAQAGLAAAAQAERMASADLSSTAISDLACGVEGIGLHSYSFNAPNSRSTVYSSVVQDRNQRESLWMGQVALPAVAAAGFVGDYSDMQGYLSQQQQQQQVRPVMSAVQGYLLQQQQQQQQKVGPVMSAVQGQHLQQKQQQQQLGPAMPTTFCKGLSTAHGTWQHDGTDFTSGHLEQVLPESWKRRPGTAPARQAGSVSNSNSSRPLSPSPAAADRPRSSNRSRVPARRQQQEQQQQKQQQQQNAPIQGPLTPELQRIMDPDRHTDTSRDSWYCYTPVEVLKIEREQQRAAEQEWLSEFHPTLGAKYPQRSAAVYRYMPQWPHSAEDDADWSGDTHTSIECKADARQSGSERSASDGVGNQDYESVVLVDNKATDHPAAADAVDAVKQPAWWEGDEKLARLVKFMLQPSFAPSKLVKTLSSRSTAYNSSADHNSSTVYSNSNSNTVYTDGSQDRGRCSQTLGVYDGLIADNAVRVADIGEQMMLYEKRKGKKKSKQHTSSSASWSRGSNTSAAASSCCSQMTATGFVTGTLQTPGERHSTWVSELAHRSVRQRQQQILLEAAGVAAASG